MQLLETSYRKKSGIYKITNLANGKFYIGSASCLYNRSINHKEALVKQKHRNNHLLNSWNKYGFEQFKIEVIEFCEKNKLIEREQYYLDTLNPQFNIRKIANSNLGLKRSKEAIENHRSKMIGRKHSQESIDKMILNTRERCKQIDQLDMNNNHIATFESITEASSKTGIPRSCISRCISGSRNHTYNFKWRITNEC